MSELKAYIGPAPDEKGLAEYYLKFEADAAIAELKADNEKLKAENAELKVEINCKKAVGQSWFERCMEARTGYVRSNRALWLARAQRANEHYHRYHGKFLCPLEDIPEYVKWKQVERKCRVKAEEYK